MWSPWPSPISRAMFRHQRFINGQVEFSIQGEIDSLLPTFWIGIKGLLFILKYYNGDRRIRHIAGQHIMILKWKKNLMPWTAYCWHISKFGYAVCAFTYLCYNRHGMLEPCKTLKLKSATEDYEFISISQSRFLLLLFVYSHTSVTTRPYIIGMFCKVQQY